MIDRIFTAVLTFCLLAGGTLAFGSELLGEYFHGGSAGREATMIVQLPPVEVHAKRIPPNEALAQADSIALAVMHIQ